MILVFPSFVFEVTFRKSKNHLNKGPVVTTGLLLYKRIRFLLECPFTEGGLLVCKVNPLVLIISFSIISCNFLMLFEDSIKKKDCENGLFLENPAWYKVGISLITDASAATRSKVTKYARLYIVLLLSSASKTSIYTSSSVAVPSLMSSIK